MRPVTGVITLASECLEAGKSRNLRRGQTSRRHDAELRGDSFATLRRNSPAARRFIEECGGHARIELDVAAQIEPVDGMIDISEDFRLARVALAPAPFLLQLLGKRIGIIHALDVAARAGIAIPVPGSADTAARFVNAR
jgi:hypothetical protein